MRVYSKLNPIDRYQREIECQVRKEFNDKTRRQAKKVNCEDMISHYVRQEEILKVSLSEAKDIYEAYRLEKTLEYCRSNLAKWQKIAEEAQAAHQK